MVFTSADPARDDRRAQKRQRGEKIGYQKTCTPRDLSSTPKRKKEPVGEQPARHAGAEVVDEGQERHLGDEHAGGLGDFLLRSLWLVLLRRWRDKRNKSATLKRIVKNETAACTRPRRIPAPALLKKLRQAGGQSADRAHHRADKSVQRENLIAIFRPSIFPPAGLLPPD